MTPKRDFFIHVNIISDLFKKKFLAYLKQAYRAGKLQVVGETAYLARGNNFQQLLDRLYQKKWNSYCKKPFGGPEKVLNYLVRYTNRVAISNNRIVTLEAGNVTFKWRDYRDGNKHKLMTVDVFEFMRRFLLHILPHGFFKICYYGILASCNHRTDLELCKRLLQSARGGKIARQHQKLSWEDLMLELFDIDVRRCPVCGKDRLVAKQLIPWNSHAPPRG